MIVASLFFFQFLMRSGCVKCRKSRTCCFWYWNHWVCYTWKCEVDRPFRSTGVREKGWDLTQSYDKSPYTHRKPKKKSDNTQTSPKTSITQRLRTDLGRSAGATTATQLVLLNQLTGSQPSHSPQQLCNRGNEHAGISLQLDLNMYSLQRKWYWKDILSGIIVLLERTKNWINVWFKYFGTLKCPITQQLLYPLRTVNLGKKQKCLSLSCRWSQIQQDTYGLGNSQSGFLWTRHHRCTCTWN